MEPLLASIVRSSRTTERVSVPVVLSTFTAVPSPASGTVRDAHGLARRDSNPYDKKSPEQVGGYPAQVPGPRIEKPFKSSRIGPSVTSIPWISTVLGRTRSLVSR